MTTTPVTRWVKYKTYSGYLSKGGPKIDNPVNPALHIDRAVFLAGQLEAGSWGTVQGYDGCAMSGGILHNIMVSPRDESQGSFGELLALIATSAPDAFKEIRDSFTSIGWTLTPDGKLRHSAGALLPASAIRLEISGAVKGDVPKVGPGSLRAKAWAEKFFRLLSDPATRRAQSDYAAKWLAAGNSADEMTVYRHFTRNHLDSMIGIPWTALPPNVELAMCVYHAFSVNAPGIAKACLAPVVTWLRGPGAGRTDAEIQFSTRLIRSLGTRKYGNWMDDPTDGNRYDKTRLAVWRRPDLWEASVARRLMPKDL